MEIKLSDFLKIIHPESELSIYQFRTTKLLDGSLEEEIKHFTRDDVERKHLGRFSITGTKVQKKVSSDGTNGTESLYWVIHLEDVKLYEV